MAGKRDLDPGASPLDFFGAEVRRLAPGCVAVDLNRAAEGDGPGHPVIPPAVPARVTGQYHDAAGPGGAGLRL